MLLIQNTPLRALFCGSCGILFALPDQVAEDRVKLDAEITCPNGHAHLYGNNGDGDDDEPTAKERELGEQVMRLRHQLEQAEARATEATGSPAPEPDPAPDPEPRPATASSRPAPLACPHCRRTYRLTKALRNHLVDVHKADGAAADDAVMHATRVANGRTAA